MKIHWQFDQAEIERVRSLVKSADYSPAQPPPVTQEQFWHSLVRCLLTPRRRSIGSSILLNTVPFPLRLEVCRTKSDKDGSIISQVLLQFGIRGIESLGGQLSKNFEFLESGGWETTLAILEKVRTLQTPDSELDAVAFITASFKGFRAHLSRMILQFLGLTRFEIPMSGQMIQWHNRNGFPIQLSWKLLMDETVYDFATFGIRNLCEQAGTFPCVLDAIVSKGNKK